MRAKKYLKSLLQDIVLEKGLNWPGKVSIELPKDKRYGDLATNLALVLSGQAQIKPPQLANELLQEIMQRSKEIEKIEIAGPGFMNFFFIPRFWQKTILDIQKQGNYFGKLDYGQGKKINVEYVSANPTGPLHVGHGRGAAVGDSLTRILRTAGYEVTTEYYLNDAGRQMHILGKSIFLRYQELCGEQIDFPEEYYQGDYIRDLAQEIKRDWGKTLLQKPWDEAIDICRDKGGKTILALIKQDLELFRVEHQVWSSEKAMLENGIVDRMLTELAAKDLTYEKEGALWYKSSIYGDDKDRVLRKSDGELTYFATDIAYHAQKFKRGFEQLIDLWGSDHHGYVPRMKAAIRGLDHKASDLEVLLIQLVNLKRQGEQISMSTRAGQFDTLAEICAEVGPDAARFIFLSRKSDSALDVDLDLLKKKSMDNPVYYVQYAHARICSVLRKCAQRGVQLEEINEQILACLDTSEDLELLQLMDSYPEQVLTAARTLNPHHVCYYLQNFAAALHRYYNKHQVLNAPNKQTLQARLHLIKCVATIISNGLFLLGVTAPQKM